MADSVRIEADLGVANSTKGENTYKKSTNAQVDDIVKFEVWYHNKEDEDSGKVANNLKIKATIPSQKGSVQNVAATVSSDNSNTVTSDATVNLAQSNAYLEFIPGSVYWRHNAGTNQSPNFVTQQITDAVVTGAGGAVIENTKPCFNFQATVTFLARVKADVIDVDKKVRVVGKSQWKDGNKARVEDTLEYQIKISNKGNTRLTNVLVGDNLPAYVSYVPGSTVITNKNHPNGDPVPSDNITTGGINIGNAGVGGVAYMSFKATLDSDKFKKCGDYILKNVAVVDSDQTGPYEDAAKTTVNVECEEGEKPPKKPPVEELPNTGVEGPLAGILGAGSLGTALRSYLRSRKSLAKALVSK